MPLVRADGLPTQHMRALAYWAAAPELDDVISLQVCGNEWVSHVTCRRQLIDALGVENGNGNGSARGGGPPTHDVFHGMVAREPRIDHLEQGRGAADRPPRRVAGRARSRPSRSARGAPRPPAAASALPAQDRARLLPPAADDQAGRVRAGEAAARGQGQPRLGPGAGRGAPAARAGARRRRGRRDPDYRFAVVQSEIYRRHLAPLGRGLRRAAAGPLPLPLRPLVPRGRALARGRAGGRRRCSTRAVRGLGLEGA